MEIKTIIFWVLVAACIIPGVIFGFKKLSGHADSEAYFKRWGYPLWFMHVLGFTEIACSILMVISATRIYAIGIFGILVIGAFYTHVKYKDSKKDVIKPIVVGGLLAVIFFLTFQV